jgi:LL-diaminopimelate aminotransferase
MLVINYPNSPTGKVATRDFYKRVIEFAHQNRIVVVQDAAHICLTYKGNPLSFLEVEGAKDVGVEVHSLSKGFNMIGWRIGFVAGNSKIVQAFADVKDNSDSGQFMAIQRAGAVALDTPEIPIQVKAKYERRLKKLVETLRSVGFDASMPEGTYFLYTKSPKGCAGVEFPTAEDASQFLITQQSVCTVPWDDAGPHLRFSVTYTATNEHEEDILMQETRQRLGALGLRF